MNRCAITCQVFWGTKVVYEVQEEMSSCVPGCCGHNIGYLEPTLVGVDLRTVVLSQ